MGDNILVSVVCTTYNQKKYIRQCLDSLLMQKTDFEYEVIIHDDASTDGTTDIVREYEDKYDNVVAICEEENQFSKFAPFFVNAVIPVVRGKYIATCEGDDFWTDKQKLQIQADFLEQHSEYVMCVHAAYYANEDGSLKTEKSFAAFDEDKEITTEEIIEKWSFATNSRMYKKDVFPITPPPYKGKCRNTDFINSVYFSLQGKIYYMNRLMSAYRVNSEGSISRKCKTDVAYQIEQHELFIEMLKKLDECTDYRYHDSIEKHMRKRLFSLYWAKADIKHARQIKEHYKNLTYKQRIKLFIESFI